MPLADRIRPSTLDEVVGQRHILAQGKPLYNIISRGKIPNMIFYGPSGVGKYYRPKNKYESVQAERYAGIDI